MQDLDYDRLSEHLAAVEADTSAAGFDGLVAGLWCRRTTLPEDLGLDAEERSGPDWQALVAYAEAARAALESADSDYGPLLPPDEAPLASRVAGVADWSAGLLYGIGQAGELDRKAVSGEVEELLRDLTEMCKIAVDDDADEEAELAYSEIVEFLKVAAQTLYVELHPKVDSEAG